MTMIKVTPFLLRSKRSLVIFSPVVESRLPVGSSAKITSGSLTMARAIQTRCFCPPERSLALLPAFLSSSTIFRAFSASFLRLKRLTFAILSGKSTFSRTVSLAFIKNCWKTKPNLRFLIRLSSLLPSLVEFLPSI